MQLLKKSFRNIQLNFTVSQKGSRVLETNGYVSRKPHGFQWILDGILREQGLKDVQGKGNDIKGNWRQNKTQGIKSGVRNH